MIYLRTLTRKLIRGTSNGSRMYITGRLKRCKVWNTFISTFFVVSGTKRSALSNHNLESFEDILQGLVCQTCSTSMGHMIFGHSNRCTRKEWAFLKDQMLSKRKVKSLNIPVNVWSSSWQWGTWGFSIHTIKCSWKTFYKELVILPGWVSCHPPIIRKETESHLPRHMDGVTADNKFGEFIL